MYDDDMYKCMLECVVARKLDEPSNELAGELKSRYELAHPEICLVVDQVDCNILQRGDRHVGGRKYCCEIRGCHRTSHHVMIDTSPVLALLPSRESQNCVLSLLLESLRPMKLKLELTSRLKS